MEKYLLTDKQLNIIINNAINATAINLPRTYTGAREFLHEDECYMVLSSVNLTKENFQSLKDNNIIKPVQIGTETLYSYVHLMKAIIGIQFETINNRDETINQLNAKIAKLELNSNQSTPILTQNNFELINPDKLITIQELIGIFNYSFNTITKYTNQGIFVINKDNLYSYNQIVTALNKGNIRNKRRIIDGYCYITHILNYFDTNERKISLAIADKKIKCTNTGHKIKVNYDDCAAIFKKREKPVYCY